MANDTNPYQSPQTEIDSVKSLTSPGILTETMVLYLKEAAPWLRFIGIIGYISVGIMGVSGLIIIIAVPNLGTIVPSWSEATVSGLAGLVYLIAGVLLFFPARFIYNFGSRIRNFVKNNAEQELELAFKNNKSLWKFVGINTIISLSFIPIGIAITIIAVVINLV